MTLSTGLLYGLMQALAGLARALPRRVALALAAGFAYLVWRLYRLSPVRDFVPGNLATAFPEWSDRRILATGGRALANLTRAIVEIMRFPRFHRDFERIVRCEGEDHLERALAAGKGAVLVSAHLGNWEIMGAAAARRFRPVAGLVQNPSKDAFGRLFVEYREKVGVATYSNAGPQALRPILRALRRGEIVVLLCDQHGEAEEGIATFFGRRVAVPLGPFVLARRTGAAIVPAYCVREGAGHVLRFEATLPVEADPDRNAQALMSRYEAWIREYPDQWLWPHNRFEKADPPGGGFAAWPRRSARGLATALALAAAASLASWGPPAGAMAFKPLIVALPDKLAVVDSAHPDTWGAIPLPGRAETTHVVASEQVLVAHVPGASALCLVDLKPFSPHQYQAFQVFRSPELAAYDLGMAEVAGKVLLGYGKTPLAELTIQGWKLVVGFDRPDAIPFQFSTARTLYLPRGVFTLKDGAVTYEPLDRHPHWQAATPRSLRLRYKPTAMVAGPAGRHLYISEAGQGGKGRLSDVDPESREVRRELAMPGPLASVVWADDRTLAVLSGRHVGIVDVVNWKLTRWFKLEVPGGPPVRLLPAHTPRAADPRT
ncbi:MAG: lysophospholipid acyltransferase family protein [Candidatus Sericytochromatia bacterium]|nr:lysophospholipid acyltransferase family protein [Candidatus Tanganyikabacteria bacterium]